MTFIQRITIGASLFLCTLSLQAQYAGSEDLLQNITHQFQTLDSLIFSMPPESEQSYLQTLVSGTSQYNTFNDSIISNAIQHETHTTIKAMKSQTGLQINGQSYYRMDERLGMDEDDGVSRYKAKIQAELGWNFLQSSAYRRKGKTNQIRLEGAIKRNQYDRKIMQEEVLRLKEDFQQEYDSLLAGTLQHRLNNLTLLCNAQEYLLQTEHISSEGLLSLINEKADAERTLAAIPQRYPLAASLHIPQNLFAVHLDTAQLLSDIRSLHSDIELLNLQIKLLEQQKKNTDYWQSMSLKPFIRYSYYIRPTISNSSNVDVGISFSIPLSNESKQKKRVLQAQQQVLTAEKEQLSDKVSLGIITLIQQIERLNKELEGEYHRLASLKQFLSIRAKGYKNQIGEYDRLTRLKEYNSFLQSMESLFGYQYQRNCLLADLQLYVEKDITDYLIFKPI